MQRPGALGQPGVAHLQGRGPACPGADGLDLESLAVKGFHGPRVGARDVEPRAGSPSRRHADDAGVDEGRAGGPDDGGDILNRSRGDGVAVHIDGLGAGPLHGLGHVFGEPQGRRRRQDRQHQGGPLDHGVEGAQVGQAPGPGKAAGVAATPGKAGDDPMPVPAQRPADGMAHVARHEDGDGVGGHAVIPYTKERSRGRSPIGRPPSRGHPRCPVGGFKFFHI